jgi:hypothetical protein
MSTIPIEAWTSRAKKHAEWVSPLADAFLKRRGLGLTHAVHDFLFTYYGCSPQKLKQWVPSFEEHLEFKPGILTEYPWFNEYWFCYKQHVLSLNRERLSQSMAGLATFVAQLCKNILDRPARFGCFGLHEWAMVYKSKDPLRHQGLTLRVSEEELAKFVESQTICCSHYDAYRFFTPDARPLNVLNPLLETRLEMEQGGCVHANMDLYKWAIKLWPWIGSDLIAKTFWLATIGRELDMRASPYDLTHLGYFPLYIETEEGRKLYQQEQQQLTQQATALRHELLAFCNRFLLSF